MLCQIHCSFLPRLAVPPNGGQVGGGRAEDPAADHSFDAPIRTPSSFRNIEKIAKMIASEVISSGGHAAALRYLHQSNRHSPI